MFNEEVCGECKHNELHKRVSQGKKTIHEAWYCNNPRSEYYMDYTNYNDSCEEWESKE